MYNPVTKTIKYDFLIFKTNVLRNDRTLIDCFDFHKKYESLAYAPYKEKPANFSERNPAFKLYMHVQDTLARFNMESYRDKAQISKGEVLLSVYESEDNDLSVDVIYWDKNNRDNNRIGNWVTINLDDVLDSLEMNEYKYIIQKLTDYWDAYFESGKPNIRYLQERYLTHF